MGILSKLFDFSTPDFSGINAKLDRIQEIDDATDYSGIDDLTEEQEREGNALLAEKWQLYEELKDKVVCVTVEEEEARPWWKVW